jgi:hypothetical protein
MTGTQFVAGFTAHEPVFPVLARRENWAVCFEYSFRGEAPTRTTEKVEATSEASAIKAALVKALGSKNRAMHSLTLLAVNRTL